MKKKDERPWTVQGGKPSGAARVRACLVLLGRPPVIPARVFGEIRCEDSESEDGPPVKPSPQEDLSRGDENARKLLGEYLKSPEDFDQAFDEMFPPEDDKS